MNKANVIDEKTLMPIGALVIIIGAVAWMTSIYFTSKSNAASIETIVKENKHYKEKIYDRVQDIDKKLVELKSINRQLKNLTEQIKELR